jgi:hypothetical protein
LKEFFSVKNSPLGDQGTKFLKKRAVGDHRWIFDGKTFLSNSVWFDAVLNADSE